MSRHNATDIGRIALPCVTVAVAALLIIVGAQRHIHRNMSNSLPIELPYFVWTPTRAVAVGDLVEACPPVDAAIQARERKYAVPGSCPGGVAPFLKLVAAVAGDVVTVSSAAVSVNGHALPNSAQVLNDAHGRAVLLRPYGTHHMRRGEIWLYGTNVRSFDSRKFGPVPETSIRYKAWAPIVSAPLPDLRMLLGKSA